MASLRSVGLSLSVAAAAVTAVGLAPQLAAEAAPPPLVRVDIANAPANLRAGGDTARMNAIARQQSGGPADCQRVRWAISVVTPSGLDPADIQVTRNENGAVVPLDQSRIGDALRLTDQRNDDGQLCRGRSVSARYAVTVPDAGVRGLVTLTVEALDEQGQRLGSNDTSISVTGGVVTPAVPRQDAGSADGPAAAESVPGAPPVRSAASALPEQVPFAWFVVGGLIMAFSGGWFIRLLRRRRRVRAQKRYPLRDDTLVDARLDPREEYGYAYDDEYALGWTDRQVLRQSRVPARRSVLRA